MQVLPTHMNDTYIITKKKSEIVLLSKYSVLCFSSEKLFSKNSLMFVNSACFVYIFLLEIRYTIGTLGISNLESTWQRKKSSLQTKIEHHFFLKKILIKLKNIIFIYIDISSLCFILYDNIGILVNSSCIPLSDIHPNFTD